MGTSRRRLWAFVCGVGAVLVPIDAALAGMTSYTLSDVVKARLDVISFFLVLMLLMAWGFKVCWNVMADDFPRLPRLSFGSACAAIAILMVFSGFVLILISGARELMTPGAWSKVGAGYELRGPEDEPQVWTDAARRRALEQLRDALWGEAEANDGKLALAKETSGIQFSLWRAPDPQGSLYGYLPRSDSTVGFYDVAALETQTKLRKLKGDSRGYVLVFEPEVFGKTRFVILSTGEVKKLKVNEMIELVTKERKEGQP